MSYASVDKLQKMLATEVFGYAADKKKASGRALGTLVEIITFYTLCAWKLRDAIAIERAIPEFANLDIIHNVEFSLHPIMERHTVSLHPLDLPVTSRKLINAGAPIAAGHTTKSQQLVTSKHVMRNAAVISKDDQGFTTANLSSMGCQGLRRRAGESPRCSICDLRVQACGGRRGYEERAADH